jgi:hypothetical protein
VCVHYTNERLPYIKFCRNEKCILLKEIEKNLSLTDTNRSFKNLSRESHEEDIVN